MLAACNICFLKTINYIEAQRYLVGANGLKVQNDRKCPALYVSDVNVNIADSFLCKFEAS